MSQSWELNPDFKAMFFFPRHYKQTPQLSWRKSIKRRSELRLGDSLPSTLRSSEQKSVLDIWACVPPSKCSSTLEETVTHRQRGFPSPRITPPGPSSSLTQLNKAAA